MQPIENIYRARHFCELKRRGTKRDWFCSAVKVLLFRFFLWGPTLPCHFLLSVTKISEEHCWHCIWREEMVSVRNCCFPWALHCSWLCWNNFSCREAACNTGALHIDPACQVRCGKARGSPKERGWWRRARQALSSDTFARLKIWQKDTPLPACHREVAGGNLRAGNHSPFQHNQRGNRKSPSHVCRYLENSGNSGWTSFL